MSRPVICVENLSKRYLLSHRERAADTSLREAIAEKCRRMGHALARPLGHADSGHTPEGKEEFWALKEVSFTVNRGDRVGIIGRNGAGKSTLLKVLSRIIEPSGGRVGISGRVASLLEVGTGFHPELTGRENIFLNGAILGMARSEIRRKFDEIVAFAEVERFLDTPVKHYSSGMYVRLAFAVAAHLEPEILIVDEVLAVGDAQFQRKCLGKMEEVSANQGRTVLFVSHNMEAISVLCNRGIVLQRGTVQFEGNIDRAIATYTAGSREAGFSVATCHSRTGSGGIRIQDVWLADSTGERTSRVTQGELVSLCLSAQVEPLYQDKKKIAVGFGIDSLEGRRLFTAVSSWENTSIVTSGERLEVRCSLPSIPLVPGSYLVSASILFQIDPLDSIMHCASFDVTEGAKACYAQRNRTHGELHFPCSFTFQA